MRRWKTWSALLFAVVLSLGMIGVAAADPPDPHPACEKENPPPGCEENGRPGDPDEDDDEGEDPGGDENPLAPLGEVCSQVVQAVLDGGAPEDFAQIHALCEALGAEPLDDGEEEPEEPEEPGDEESPTQPIADGCNTVIDEMVGGGAPPEVEQGRQLCDQFGEHPDDGDEEPEEPEEPGDGDEESPLAEGCDQVVDGLVGVAPDFEQARALCEQAP